MKKSIAAFWVVLVILLGFFLASCEKSIDEHDLTQIGKGKNVVVQIHDPN